jgi:SAM-dependent methyltransferase
MNNLESNPLYGEQFYVNRNSSTQYAAGEILSIVDKLVPRLESVVDVGCGIGTWLAESNKLGARTINGLDGPWVDERFLVIPETAFTRTDLEKPFSLPMPHDLAISLEVAEHLSPNVAEQFIKSLCGLSDYVLFSAAIPGQGGVGHVNEQWPSYWAEIFDREGFFAYDYVRPQIWSDERIPFWYRQNTLLFSRRDINGGKVGFDRKAGRLAAALDLVHPEHYRNEISRMASVRGSWKVFSGRLRNWAGKIIR